MRNTLAPGIWTWPTTRAGSADSVAETSSTVRNSTAITGYREPGEARMGVATGNSYTCTATSRKPSDSLAVVRNARLLMIFRVREANDLLEPCAGKLASTVLRGRGGGDTLSLPGEASPVMTDGFSSFGLRGVRTAPARAERGLP